jgi:hypothetical protein
MTTETQHNLLGIHSEIKVKPENINFEPSYLIDADRGPQASFRVHLRIEGTGTIPDIVDLIIKSLDLMRARHPDASPRHFGIPPTYARTMADLAAFLGEGKGNVRLCEIKMKSCLLSTRPVLTDPGTRHSSPTITYRWDKELPLLKKIESNFYTRHLDLYLQDQVDDPGTPPTVTLLVNEDSGEMLIGASIPVPISGKKRTVTQAVTEISFHIPDQRHCV